MRNAHARGPLYRLSHLALLPVLLLTPLDVVSPAEQDTRCVKVNGMTIVCVDI